MFYINAFCISINSLFKKLLFVKFDANCYNSQFDMKAKVANASETNESRKNEVVLIFGKGRRLLKHLYFNL